MICVQLRFSLSFSIPRCRYPMTTSASTTFSPSRRSTTRSTPCVLGCCGPMLMTSSSVSNIAPRTASRSKVGGLLINVRSFLRLAGLQPVERVFHQQFARPFERIVLPLRKALPVVRHQNPPAIRMAGEIHAEHIPPFALEPVRRRPYGRRRWKALLFADLDLHAYAVPI